MRNENEWDKLTEYLEHYADHKPQGATFDMWEWRKETSCGFAACAIGHLPYACPESPVRFMVAPYYVAAAARGEITQEELANAFLEPYFTDDPSSEAAPPMDRIADYFGIKADDAEYCFSPREYIDGCDITPQMVAERMDEISLRYD